VNGGGGLVGVTCFSVDPVKGLCVTGPMRGIPQPGNASPPPPGIPPEILTGDIAFNPSSSGVFITLTNSTHQPGYIYAYPTIDGEVSQTPVISSLKDVANPFSLNFLGSDSRLFSSNPHNQSPGSVVLDVSPSLEATEAKIVTIPAQSASCWVAYASAYDTLFVIDAALPNVTTVDSTNGNTIAQFGYFSPAFGATDSLVDRHFLYTLTVPFNANFSALLASPQVLVWDIASVEKGQNPRQIQSFDIFKAAGLGFELMGLAIYPSNPSNQ
jgi:hypothetical protein